MSSKAVLILLTNGSSVKEKFEHSIGKMKIYQAGNCFNEYHMGKQNESTIKKIRNLPLKGWLQYHFPLK